MRFADKTVIVTGAGSGIGAATARLFVAEGARDGGFDLALRNAKKRTEHVRGSVRPLA